MKPSDTSITVFGARGRMGSRIIALALDDPRFTIARAATRDEDLDVDALRHAHHLPHATSKQRENKPETVGCDVVIDFTSPSALDASIALARSAHAALLVGTTGLDSAHVESLKKLSTIVPVLLSPNTSMGVAVLASLAQRAAKILGEPFECSIVEAHHSRKKDSPSGTALRLRDAVRAGDHSMRDDQVVAMRGGDVIGEHTVRFAGPHEYIELTHRATSRDLFAQGALNAALWLKGRAPGWYSMNDVLGIVT